MEWLTRFLDSSLFVYLFLIAIVVMVCLLVSCLLMFLLRLIFKRIRFFVCTILAVVILGVGVGYLALNPLVTPGSSPTNVQAVYEAVSQFRGFYGWKMPLVAWRFDEYSPNEILVSPETGSQTQNSDLFVRVQYLPIGEIVLKYDVDHGTFVLEKGLNQNETHSIVSQLFNNVGKNVLDSLPVVKPASTNE